MQRPLKSEEDTGSLVTEIRHGCGLPCGCWESNLGPLEEQPALLAAESSLWSPLVDSHIFGGTREEGETFYTETVHKVPLQSNLCHVFPMIWDYKRISASLTFRGLFSSMILFMDLKKTFRIKIISLFCFVLFCFKVFPPSGCFKFAVWFCFVLKKSA